MWERIADDPQPWILGVSAAVIGLSLALGHLPAAALLAPAVALSCNAMRERAIKDATILPRTTDQVRKQVALKELDDALIAFGRKMKELAATDPGVRSAVSAFKAEHAAENPVLDLLPRWKERLAKGQSVETEAALAEFKAAILAELKRTSLTADSAEKIEELFKKSGWEETFRDWESKYKVLEALREDAKKELEAKKKSVEIPKVAGGSSSATATLGAFLMFFASAALASWNQFSAYVSSFSAMNFVAEPAPPPVPLDSFLASAGLNGDEVKFLRQFTSDLGAKETAPIIGRVEEIKRFITILSKPPGTQNNPMLLGDKGVGKTAIVEAVAQRLYQNRLPSLKGKRILELDVGALTAGTGIQGEMEKRLTALRTILAKTNNRVVLFVDEIHSILKNVSTANAVPDLLKAPLRNGEMTVVGATTVGEYRKYLESDPAFADRFSPIMVEEPSVEDAIEMLLGDQEYLEKKFGVSIEPGAIEAAVRLSARYIPEKFLPRKARIDVLEKALAQAKPEAARDGVQVQIDQLTDRLRIQIKRYAALKTAPEDSPELRAKQTEAYNRIVATYQGLVALEETQRSIRPRSVTKEDVVRVIAEETGIPVGDLGQDEFKKLQRMEPWFKERIVGQGEAVSAIADAVRTNKANLNDPNRPVGAFLFAGKTGVGKTELARTLAEFLFGDKDAIIRLDMSEYMEKFSVQRLFGAPPGYVGYDEGGELTEKVKRKPYSVIVLDEIEKAHPDVLNAFLQILDAGRMTDNKKNTVNFKNTIIIMTTNLGSESAAEGEAFRRDVMDAIRARLRPEFVNRIDKTVVFNPLTLAQAEDIVRILLKDVAKRLRENDLTLEVTPEAVSQIAALGFDPRYGARPLKRMVESKVSNGLSPFLLEKQAEGELVNGGRITVDVKDGEIFFRLAANPPPQVELARLPDGPLGEKLRRILEDAVKPGSQMTGDLASFEAVLFPERELVTLKEPMGAFRPNTGAGDSNGSSMGKSLSPDPDLGKKDPWFEELKAELSREVDPRWKDPRTREAARAWAEAFSLLAKRFAADRPKLSASTKVMFERRFPSEDREGEIVYSVKFAMGDDFQREQRLFKLLRDHFSVPMADEDAVRARAAALKDEGKEADRDLLDVKRLIEVVPGVTFGFSVAGQDFAFWFKAPVGPKPKTPSPLPQVYFPDQGAKTARQVELLGLVEARPDDFLAKLRERAGGLISAEDRAKVEEWVSKTAAMSEKVAESEEPTFRAQVDQEEDGTPTGNLTLSVELDSESGMEEAGEQVFKALEPLVRTLSGARFGYSTDWRSKDSPAAVTLWLQVPVQGGAPARDFGIFKYQQAAPSAESARTTIAIQAFRADQGQQAVAYWSELDERIFPLLQNRQSAVGEAREWFERMLAVANRLGVKNALWISALRSESDGAVLLAIQDGYDPGSPEGASVETLLRENLSIDADDFEDAKNWASQLSSRGIAADPYLMGLKYRLRSIPGATFGYLADPKTKTFQMWLNLPGIPGEAPITALDARANPSKMLLFLTQGYPASLQPLRKLAADLLAADVTTNRVLGLHLASGLLPPAALEPLARRVLNGRVTSAQDLALAAELGDVLPAGTMQPERDKVAALVEVALRDQVERIWNDPSARDEFGSLDLYAALLSRFGLPAEPALGQRLHSRMEDSRTRRRIAIARYAAIGAALLFLLGGLPLLLHWSLKAVVAGVLLGLFAAGLTAAVFASRYDRQLERLRGTLSLLDLRAMPFFPPQRQADTARRWLRASLRGYQRADKEMEAFGRTLDTAAGMLTVREKARALRSFRRSMTSLLRRVERAELGKKDGQRFESLLLFGWLHDWAPAEDRPALTELWLKPLRLRRILGERSRYGAALGAWLEKASLTPAQSAETFALLSQALEVEGGDRSALKGLAPAFAALASKELDPETREAFDQLLRELTAESSSDVREVLDLQVLRARLGYGERAWETVRGLKLKSLDTTQTAGPLAELVRLSPPSRQDAEALEKLVAAGGPDATAALLETALSGTLTLDRLPALVRAALGLDFTREARYGEVLRAIRGSAAAAAATEEKKNPGAMKAALDANLSRLKQQ